MKNYEILLIINPQFSDEEVPSILESIFNVIKKNNGAVKEHKILGRNKLAYPIKRAKFGVYVLAQVEIEPIEIKKLNAELAIMSEILRFDISNEISKGDFSFKLFEIKDQSEIGAAKIPTWQEKKVESAAENLDKENAISETKEESSLESPEDMDKKEKDLKISLDELDKKLDEILKEEII